jgi:predicted nucleic acid-binding protein
MLVYLDTSAAFKLFSNEPESKALRAWWEESNPTPVSSDLLRVELLGNVAAKHPALSGFAETLIRQVNLVSIRPELLSVATELVATGLGTLDAIHLATALSAGDEIKTFLTYDPRLSEAAEKLGLESLRPGQR